MSTSSKHPNTIRQGGPGASHENAKKPMNEPPKPDSDPGDQHAHSGKSSGGGEQDSHHTRDPGLK